MGAFELESGFWYSSSTSQLEAGIFSRKKRSCTACSNSVATTSTVAVKARAFQAVSGRVKTVTRDKRSKDKEKQTKPLQKVAAIINPKSNDGSQHSVRLSVQAFHEANNADGASRGLFMFVINMQVTSESSRDPSCMWPAGVDCSVEVNLTRASMNVVFFSTLYVVSFDCTTAAVDTV